jgi:hypothetical protein
VYGGEAARASEKLQADAMTKAANATHDAAKANERAAVLETEAATATERAAALGVTVDNLNETVRRKTADADTAITSLNDTIEKANAKIAAVQQQQAQRRLTDAQKQAIISAISPYRGQKVTIESVLGNGETKAYRDAFVEIFDAAGWDHNGDKGIAESVYDRDPVGIQITVHMVDIRQGSYK